MSTIEQILWNRFFFLFDGNQKTLLIWNRNRKKMNQSTFSTSLIYLLSNIMTLRHQPWVTDAAHNLLFHNFTYNKFFLSEVKFEHQIDSPGIVHGNVFPRHIPGIVLGNFSYTKIKIVVQESMPRKCSPRRSCEESSFRLSSLALFRFASGLGVIGAVHDA